MKRYFALLLAVVILLSMLVACGKKDPVVTEPTIDREALANAQLDRESYVVDVVMAHCGLAEEDINVLSLNSDEEAKTIDFFFLHGDIEYVYTVNYETGEILSYSSNIPTPPTDEAMPTEPTA